jgi:hypothetical protein
MMRAMPSRDLLRPASLAGYVVGVAGALALVTLSFFFMAGQPFGTINDVALIVTIIALPFLMLAFWELGGLTPTPLALAAQALGWLAAAAWCVTHVLFITGVVGIDYSAGAASGALAIESVALIVIGLWIAGANLLAGPWLSNLRWFGLVVGVGVVLYGLGTLTAGTNGPLIYVGALAYLILLPVWGLLMGLYVAARADRGRATQRQPGA